MKCCITINAERLKSLLKRKQRNRHLKTRKAMGLTRGSKNVCGLSASPQRTKHVRTRNTACTSCATAVSRSLTLNLACDITPS